VVGTQVTQDLHQTNSMLADLERSAPETPKTLISHNSEPVPPAYQPHIFSIILSYFNSIHSLSSSASQGTFPYDFHIKILYAFLVSRYKTQQQPFQTPWISLS
jgi:hypothetical protein